MAVDLVLHAIQAPRRREILRLLGRSERSAGEIHRAIRDVTFGAVSQHLGVLEQAGLVSARREGRSRFYAVRHEGLLPLRQWLDEMWGEALSRLRELAEAEQRGGRPGRATAGRPGRRVRRRPVARPRGERVQRRKPR
jgi:DNA-binding transcriptional ArsR family regulator